MEVRSDQENYARPLTSTPTADTKFRFHVSGIGNVLLLLIKSSHLPISLTYRTKPYLVTSTCGSTRPILAHTQFLID
jgi:hypothetical protein